MSDLRKLEFFLVRYVPNVVREECVNIGLVMTESDGDGGGFADVHFLQDWDRTLRLYPDTDVDMIEALGREIKARISKVQDRALLIHEMMDRYSNVIQLSPVRQVLTEDPAREMKALVSTLVEMPKMAPLEGKAVAQHRAGRKWLLSEMTNAFESEGVLSLLQTKLPVSIYTNNTDKFTFDFAYAVGKSGETTKIFHAVSVVDKSKETEMFPFRVAKIGPKMAQLNHTKPIFAAIVEDDFDPDDSYVASVLAFMNDEGIRISRVGQMPAIAERARVELMA